MPSQGRRGGSALVAATVALAVCLSSVLNFEVAQARAYRVGGANGWIYGNFVHWPKGKNFRAGDTLG
ncbi:hypothetical protein RHMOL_Rhmol11G0193400 [Rhododendron molle]|uniref:Uncharacterized protein n=1 Tax=Rhododendron molle TaxID=49168 RepID=A0ACC0LVL6_RHOML|nr:hypothetical protein RHMOL_Rhmol11G0193400 [Rhododendron molle]